MFTGIVETTGKVVSMKTESGNLRLGIRSNFTGELKVDQSVSHNGVCLTVVAINNDVYDVIVIDETLKRSNFGSIKAGDEVNLERSMKLGDRLDGHIVQGHVDRVVKVDKIDILDGSRLIKFACQQDKNLTVEKGSVCLNGVSLTVVESGIDFFSTAIIPYTLEHTNFKSLKAGDSVNVEFDIVGKYIARLLNQERQGNR